MTNALTVMLKVKADQGKPLNDLLTQIGSDIRRNDYIHFVDMTLLHFTRFVMMDKAFTRLLFTATHDGTVADFLGELIEKGNKGVQAIFSLCEGFPTSSGDPFRRDFLKWITDNSHQPNTFFMAYPNVSHQQVKQYSDLHDKIETALNAPQTEPLVAALKQIPVNPPNHPNPVLAAIGNAVGGVLGQVFPTIVRIISPHITNDRTANKPVTVPYSTTERESIVQNELTIITEIRPERLRQLRWVLALVNFGCKLPSDGTLSGVSTIHFARWVVYDEGKMLLFESNYDGAWESYIGEFIDRAAMGLDAIWSCCYNYPPGGAKDAQAFKEQIIGHQVRAALFYSAYPQTSVKNILNNIQIARAITAVFNSAAGTDFLHRL
jgi:hypothetical protein